MYAMEEAGADIIEIGIPFSDPIAEGPVIQAANERALAAGCTTDRLFETVKKGEMKRYRSYGFSHLLESDLYL